MAGTQSIIIENVYSGATVVSTSAALLSAIASARAGAIIVLNTVVAPFTLDLASPKGKLGIDIVLPQAQICKITCTQALEMNIRVHGGTIEADVVEGTTTGNPPNFGIYVVGASKLGFYSMSIGRNRLAMNFIDASDIDMQGVTDQGGRRDDFFRIQTVSRVSLNDFTARLPEAYYNSFSWSPTGAVAPVDGLTSAQAAAQSLIWSDSIHFDFAQIEADYISTDVTIRNCDVDVFGQGIFFAGTGGTGYVDKCLIADNRIGVNELTAAINSRFKNTTIRDNQVGRVLPTTNPNGVTVSITRITGGPVEMGRNSVFPGGGTVAATIDGDQTAGNAAFYGPTVTGDASVIAPELPRLFRPTWMPAISRPAIIPQTLTMTTKPALYWGSATVYDNNGTQIVANPTAGTPVMARPGGVLGYRVGATYETRWYSNSVLISGETARMLATTGRSGQAIACEMRAIVDGVTSPWVISAAVTVG